MLVTLVTPVLLVTCYKGIVTLLTASLHMANQDLELITACNEKAPCILHNPFSLERRTSDLENSSRDNFHLRSIEEQPMCC